jgi:hypothetical protein
LESEHRSARETVDDFDLRFGDAVDGFEPFSRRIFAGETPGRRSISSP